MSGRLLHSKAPIPRRPSSRRGCDGHHRVAAHAAAGAAVLLGLGITPSASPAGADPLSAARFAVEVVAARGPFGPSPYDDPQAVLGPPATEFYDPLGTWSGGAAVRRVKLVEPAYHLDPTQSRKLLLTLDAGSVVVVRFEEPIRDDPAHPFGVDFLVFGNAAFTAAGMVHDGTDLNTVRLSGGGFFEPLLVSVSPGYTGGPGEDPTNWETWPWYRYEHGPFADTAFPTQAYHWDRAGTAWTDQLMDFTKPVNPALAAWFEPGAGRSLTAAEAIELYDGAGGGTGFDLRESGFAAIRYVKIEGRPGRAGGEVDALAAVRAAVLGDSLLVVPANPGASSLPLRFQRPETPNHPALEITLHALDRPARVRTAPLAEADLPPASPGTVRAAAELAVQPVLDEPAPVFAAEARLFVGADYPGDGRDLVVWQRGGADWTPVAFEFLPGERAVVLREVPAAAAWVVAQETAPRLEWIRQPAGFAVRTAATPGWRHVLERSADCTRWVPVVAVEPTGTMPLDLRDPAPPAAAAFYRLRLERP